MLLDRTIPATPVSLYRGRFAPSPTGPLHFGSLVAAVGSFLMARSQGGKWSIRIEDLDSPRVVQGAADDILRTLERLGFTWDGPIIYQSQRLEHYQAALTALLASGLAYPCTCSRREVAQSGVIGPTGLIYPGTCRNAIRRPGRPEAIRIKTDNRTLVFHDGVQRNYTQCLGAVGDFVIRRADGLFAYQLAVVVDDSAQHITHVVRGSDLLDSTPRQIYLQRLLGLTTPHYNHLPVVVDRQGNKLSKQTRAPPLERRHPGPALVAALRFLEQDPPAELARENPPSIWNWALANWRSEHIPRVTARYWPPSMTGTRPSSNRENDRRITPSA